MQRIMLAILCWCAAVAAGCGVFSRPMTPEQWAAIETRPVEAPRDDVLRAAAAVMLDEGYIFTMSDHSAGLLGGVELADPMLAHQYARSRGSPANQRYVNLCMVWVRARTLSRSEIRVQLYQGGARVAREAYTQEMWSKVQQRMLTYLPAKKGGN